MDLILGFKQLDLTARHSFENAYTGLIAIRQVFFGCHTDDCAIKAVDHHFQILVYYFLLILNFNTIVREVAVNPIEESH